MISVWRRARALAARFRTPQRRQPPLPERRSSAESGRGKTVRITRPPSSAYTESRTNIGGGCVRVTGYAAESVNGSDGYHSSVERKKKKIIIKK